MKAGLVAPNTREETIGGRVLERKLKGQGLEVGVEKVVESAQQQTAFGKFYLRWGKQLSLARGRAICTVYRSLIWFAPKTFSSPRMELWRWVIGLI